MKKYLKFVIIGAVMAGMIIGYYYYLSNKTSVDSIEEATTTLSQVQQMIHKNIEKDYPPTPREVLKLYSDITLLFYKESYTDEEFEELALKLRYLFDEELNEANPLGDYLASLKAEIEGFKAQNISFSSYSTSSSTDVDYFDRDGYQWARMNVAFTIRSGSNAGITKEVFILRKDNDGHWKIYGWTLAEE